ncbi:MAG TPA: endolytic transglycosylase MltG [Candidatus Yonathbacteria bacterium]|nr:endolytic transglycosylase MltG [Candidatus Yonathbacteria bacterium]
MRFDIKKILPLKKAVTALHAKDYNDKNLKKVLGVLVGTLVVLILLFLVTAPFGFPEGRMVVIEEGMSLSQVSNKLKEAKVIRSELVFEALIALFADEGKVLHGEYFFENSTGAFGVARRVTKGDFGLDPVRIAIPEGSTVVDIGELFKARFPDFDVKEFIKLASDKEGYLFPDTYLFLPNVKPKQVIREMESTFDMRLFEIADEVLGSEYELADIVVMASILEKEGVYLSDKRIIAGILWKRIEIGMPLQVDATFLYINGKNTYELTLDDLALDSPYNTYKYKGLPVGPIANPGLYSLLAAVTPEKSPYLFYLSDREGNFYYAEDFEGHKRNKSLYVN